MQKEEILRELYEAVVPSTGPRSEKSREHTIKRACGILKRAGGFEKVDFVCYRYDGQQLVFQVTDNGPEPRFLYAKRIYEMMITSIPFGVQISFGKEIDTLSEEYELAGYILEKIT